MSEAADFIGNMR